MPFLVTPPLPNLTVEIAFDSGFATPEGDRTWTDISTYVEGASSVDITYGRADELSTPDPNTCSLTLDNRDGRFTPAKSSSPYFPNVKKGKPLRVTVTYAGVDYIRFTGYVNEWPLVWPDSTSAAATVTISASSRRARLGQTAPLTSAIRAAYLATSPQAYWPLGDYYTNFDGRFIFPDITNQVTASNTTTQSLAGFTHLVALTPVVGDGTQGPTDEASLVKLPAFSDFSLVNTFPHYIGSAGAVSVLTAGAVTVEAVARVSADPESAPLATIFKLLTASQSQQLSIAVNSNTGSAREVGAALAIYDVSTGALLEAHLTDEVQGYNPAVYDSVTDGEIHHYAATLQPSGGNTLLKGYVDGAQIGTTITFTTPLPTRFTSIALGDNTYNATVWVGHAAVHDRALSAAEILEHAQAATAASESDAERVVRVAGRIGVPADEIDAEVSVALPLGPQSENGRSVAEVLDELATSTRGILYDTREGHLALQARNHRYNQIPTVSLSAELQEVQGDLTATTDDRYLVNTVEFARVGGGDAPATVTDEDSIADYGVYAQTLQIVSSSDEETQAAASDLIFRFADGGATPRVNQVSMDIVNLDATQRALVLAADIGTLFSLADLPDQAPYDPMPLFLEGYSESITATSHTLTMNTTPGGVYSNVAVLDDSAHDVLGSGIVLAY